METNTEARKFHASPIDAWADFESESDFVCFSSNPSDPDCACRASIDHMDDGSPCKCPCGLTW